MKKIAVPVDENGKLDAHFGHCKYFDVFETEDKTIKSENRLIPPPHEPGVLPLWLAQKGITDVVAGGMGQRAIQLFNQNKVNVFVGAPQQSGKDLAIGLLTDTIQFSANYCDH